MSEGARGFFGSEHGGGHLSSLASPTPQVSRAKPEVAASPEPRRCDIDPVLSARSGITRPFGVSALLMC